MAGIDHFPGAERPFVGIFTSGLVRGGDPLTRGKPLFVVYWFPAEWQGGGEQILCASVVYEDMILATREFADKGLRVLDAVGARP